MTFPFTKHCQDTCMLRLSSLELTFCLRDRSLQSAPFTVHCAPWDPKKIDKKDEVLLRASNFRKKNLFLVFSPDKRKHRCSVEFQCYKLFVKDWIDNFPYLWKKHLGKDLTFHSDDMAPQKLYIHHFHIVHNTPCLSPKFCITIVSNFSWVQWLGKISEGEQGALWSMWKKWINSRIMIILLATRQNALSPIWNVSVLFQMFFHF